MATTAPTGPSVDELEAREADAFRAGPLSVLTASVASNSQVGEWSVGARRVTWAARGGGVPRRCGGREPAPSDAPHSRRPRC